MQGMTFVSVLLQTYIIPLNPSKKPSLVPFPSLHSPSLPFPPSRFLHQLLHQLRYHFFWQVGKCYIWLRPYRRGLRFGNYLGWNFRFGLRSRGQNISKLLFFYTNAQIGSVRSCSNGLKFGMNICLYIRVSWKRENLNFLSLPLICSRRDIEALGTNQKNYEKNYV